MRITKGIILSLLPLASAWAQAPKYSNEFLSIGVGARGLAMANCQAASVEDVTSGYWNPSGLSMMRGNVQVAAMHSEYFAGIAKYDYGSVGVTVDSSHALAFSVIRFAIDDIPYTIDLIDASGNINYDRLKSFSYASYAFMFTYAWKPGIEGLRLGATVKVINQKTGDFAKSWGFGIDAGAQYEKDKWHFGVMARDITTTFNAWSYDLSQSMKDVFNQTGNEIPVNSTEITLPKLILGVGYKFNISSKITAMPELNADMTFDGQRNVAISSDPVSVDPHLGVEFGYDNFIFIRGGVNNIQTVKNLDNSSSTIFQPNMGIGLRLKNLSIDYALANVGSQETLYSNVFSLKLDIYKHK